MRRLAIDIGGTKFTAAVFEEERMVLRQSHATDRAGGREALLFQLAPLLAAWHAEAPFEACGIGFGGPVIFERQIVALSTHVSGWDYFDLPAWVRSIAGDIPVVMDRDTQAAVLGEYRFGAGQGISPLFYMTVSTGIGGGTIIDGRVQRGANGWASEIGHMNVRPDGPDCLCGSSGCLERMCCGLWLERDHGIPATELLRDPAFAARYAIDMARALKAAIMLLNPERIVIGGGISRAGDALFLPLREELARQMPPWSKAIVDVVPAALGDDSVLWGALSLVLDAKFPASLFPAGPSTSA